MPLTQKILVVGSDERGRQLIAFHLRQEGYITEESATAENALRSDIQPFSLIILDSDLKKIDGLQLSNLTNFNSVRIPLIICSVQSDSNAIINGLNAGADDYIVKPISPRIMIARVKAILRRTCC